MLTSVLQTIGNTPLLRLDLSRDLPGTVWLKLENRNPGGSIKDRVAFHLIGEALDEGRVEPGGLLVEATSGNMGIGMALVAPMRGLRCVLTMPESMSVERRNLLRVLGAELVLTPAEQGMSGAVAAAKRIAEEQDDEGGGEDDADEDEEGGFRFMETHALPVCSALHGYVMQPLMES